MTAPLHQYTADLLQACFYAPLLFLVIYTSTVNWWRSLFGRVIVTLAAVFVVVLLRSMLVIWGVLTLKQELAASPWAWITASFLTLVPLAFLTLSWQLMRRPLAAWLARQRRLDHDGSPLSPLAEEAEMLWRLSRRREERRSGRDVAPPGEIDRVDGGS